MMEEVGEVNDPNKNTDRLDDVKYPAVPTYGPCNIKNLKKGQTKMWCTCGLSKKQPWCDGSHKGTGMSPLRWVVPKEQSLFQICNCKYTKDPPFCDATHVNLPCEVLERKANCLNKVTHGESCKLCTKCGWVPDF